MSTPSHMLLGLTPTNQCNCFSSISKVSSSQTFRLFLTGDILGLRLIDFYVNYENRNIPCVYNSLFFKEHSLTLNFDLNKFTDQFVIITSL